MLSLTAPIKGLDRVHATMDVPVAARDAATETMQAVRQLVEDKIAALDERDRIFVTGMVAADLLFRSVYEYPNNAEGTAEMVTGNIGLAAKLGILAKLGIGE